MSEIARQAAGSGEAENLDDVDVEGRLPQAGAIDPTGATVLRGAEAAALALDNPLPDTRAGA